MSQNSERWCPDLGAPLDAIPAEERKDARPFLAPSALCSGVIGRRDIASIVRTTLTQYWANAGNCRTPDLATLVWSANDLATQIYINKSSKFHLAAAGSRPALLVRSGACRLFKLAIGHRDVTDARGFDNYSVMWIGSLTVFCTSKSDDQAELLQEEVGNHLLEISPDMLRYGLIQFGVVELGETMPIRGAEESFAAPVSVGYAFHHGWSLRELSLPIRAIEFQPAFAESAE